MEKTIKLKSIRSKARIQIKRVAIMYPSGNTTAVVFDQNLEQDRQQLNDLTMSTWSDNNPGQPEIEQCCFVTYPKDPLAIARVEMFGGEFCGNAARSVLSLITDNQDCQGLIEVSGVDRPLEFLTKNGIIEIEMPLPTNKKVVKLVKEGMVVQLDGITQIVVIDPESQNVQSPREMLNRLLKDKMYNLTEQPAVGVSYYNTKTSSAQFCVWVRNVNTMFDETACGSGTCAIGLTLATINKDNTTITVRQPSGETIKTTALYRSEDNTIYRSTISGKVTKLYDKELILS